MSHLSQSLKEYARGIIGGLLFSLPLLFTMEMWWTGFNASPLSLLIYIMATYSLLLGYNRFAGLRQSASWLEVAIDSVEEMGIGIMVSVIILRMIGVIDFTTMSIEEIAGKVVIEAMAVAIGVSVGTAQFGQTDEEETGMAEANGKQNPRKEWILEQTRKAILSICGAFLFAVTIGPTDEIVIIATECNYDQLLLMACFSIGLSSLVLFLSDFVGTDANQNAGGSGFELFQLLSDVSVSYIMALLASAGILWMFGRFVDVDMSTAVSEIIVLGIMGSIGASAGRLLLNVKL